MRNDREMSARAHTVVITHVRHGTGRVKWDINVKRKAHMELFARAKAPLLNSWQ